MIKQNNLKILTIFFILILLISLLFIEIYLKNNPNQSIEVTGNSQLEIKPSCTTIFFEIESNSNNLNLFLELASFIKQENFKNYTLSKINSSDNLEKNKPAENLTKDYFKLEIPLEEKENIIRIYNHNFSSEIKIQKIILDPCEEQKEDLEIQLISLANKKAKENANLVTIGIGKDLGKLLEINQKEINFLPITIYNSQKDNEKEIQNYLEEEFLQEASSQITCKYELI